MGHTCVNVQPSFWSERVILWIATVTTKGKPSSILTIAVVTLHTFALGKLDLLTVLPRETSI